MDADHIGGLTTLLEEAPRMRVVTSFLGLGKLGLLGITLPPERVHLINPGQSLDIGDRRLVALRPPVFEIRRMFETAAPEASAAPPL